MTDTFKLFRLQQLDSQLDRMRARLQTIAAALSEDEALRQAQAQVEENSAALQAERKELRRAEQNVQDQGIKIEQTEATLYGGKVRNPKELQDMQNELAALKRYLAVLEDRQLEAMLAVEAAEERSAQTAAELERVQDEFEKQHHDLVAEREILLKEQSRLETERQATAGAIAPEDITLYENLRRQRRGVAVARVTDKACAACGSVLSAAQLHAARSPSQLTRCDTCGRILYGG